MIRVKIELVPYGCEEEAYQIAELVIANAGRHADCDYNYVASYIDDKGNKGDGLLLSYDRKQPVIELLRLVTEVIQLEGLDEAKLAELGLESYLNLLRTKLTLNSESGR